MGKAKIQYKLIKTLAFSPWTYTDKMLAGELGVSQGILKRSLTEMETRGCIFTCLCYCRNILFL